MSKHFNFVNFNENFAIKSSTFPLHLQQFLLSVIVDTKAKHYNNNIVNVK